MASFVCGWALVLAYVTVVAFEVVSLPTVLGYVFDGLDSGKLYTVAGWDVHLAWVAVGIVGALAIGVVNYFGLRISSFIQGAAATTLGARDSGRDDRGLWQPMGRARANFRRFARHHHELERVFHRRFETTLRDGAAACSRRPSPACIQDTNRRSR